jgi:hypothetical protein
MKTPAPVQEGNEVEKPTRRAFLQGSGLTAGAAVVAGGTTLATLADPPLARTGCVPSRTSGSDRRVSPPTPAIPAARANGLQRLAHTELTHSRVSPDFFWCGRKLYERAMLAASSTSVPAQTVPTPGFRRFSRRNSRPAVRPQYALHHLLSAPSSFTEIVHDSLISAVARDDWHGMTRAPQTSQ